MKKYLSIALLLSLIPTLAFGGGQPDWELDQRTDIRWKRVAIETTDEGTFERPGTPLYTDPDTGILTAIGVNEARFERPAGPSTNTMGLHEPAGENLVLDSNAFRAAISGWDNTNCTVSDDATTGPDANTTADNIIEASDVAQQHKIDEGVSVTSGEAYTFSFYLKQKERTAVKLIASTTQFPGNSFARFNIASGSIIDTGAGADGSAIEESANGFYRVSMTATADGTGPNTFSLRLLDGSNNESYNGDGTSGIYAWGAQIEEAPNTSSLKITTGTTVTSATEQGQPHYTMPVQQDGSPIYETILDSELVTDGGFADIALAGTKVISGITKANPGVVTLASGHGYVNGQVILIEDLDEMTELNGEYWKIRNLSGDTCELSDAAIGTWDTSSLDTSGFGAAETTGGTGKAASFDKWSVSAGGWHLGVDGAGALTGTADCDGEQSGNTSIAENNITARNTQYRSGLTLSNRASGTVRLRQPGILDFVSADGPYLRYFTSINTADGDDVAVQGTPTFIGSIDNVSVREVLNGPPESTTVVLWRPGYDEADTTVSADHGIISVRNAGDSLIYHRGNNTQIRSADGIVDAIIALDFLKDTTYKLALQIALNSNVYQFRVGAVELGGDIAWGSWTDYSGSFVVGGNEFQLGFGLFGPMHIGWPAIWTRILTDGEINAYH